MISDELELDIHVRKDVLHGIVSVYINVCSFSFVKGIIQQYKTAEKQTKTRALRKGISRSCKGEEQQGRTETVNSHFILTILLITQVPNDQYHHSHGSSGDKFHGNTRELEVL